MRPAVPLPAPVLRPGDVVRIVAPAGPVREGELQKGLDVLGSRYEVRLGPGLEARAGYLAGDDEVRARALDEAVRDPEARAIFALRGGYGTMRILARLGPALDALGAAPKAIVGSSDLTALGCALLRRGLGWVHGPMVRTLGRTDPGSIARLWDALERPESGAAGGLVPVVPGRARGPLAGGNLSVLAALVGTPFAAELDGAIVLLEDVTERPYRIDRMLTQLLLAGALDRAAGFVIGELVDCDGPGESPTALEVVVERLSGLRVPIAAGFPAAHGARCWASRMGENVELDATAGTIEPLV